MGASGKCIRLPYPVRMGLNERIADGVPYEVILAWLAEQPGVAECVRDWFGGRAITAQNLSNYKASGEYELWLSRRDSLTAALGRQKYVLDASAQGGMDLLDAGDSMMTSHLLDMMESTEDTGEKLAIMKMFANLRDANTSRQTLELKTKELENKVKQMAADARKAEITAVKKFMEWAGRPEAQAIIGGAESKAVQMDQLHELLFGTS